MLRIVLVQKPAETSALLNQARTIDHKQLSSGFKKLMELVRGAPSVLVKDGELTGSSGQ